MDIQLHPEAMMLVPLLLILGTMLKSVKQIPDWSIPWILLLFSGIYFFVKDGFTAEALANTVAAVGVAVYGNQLYKQTIVNRSEDRK
jgi:drug/metabolite transporter (DMT)-like permease